MDKANTDDMRDSPSIEIVEALQKAGANIKIYDPSFSDQAKKIFGNVSWEKNPYDCCNDADVVLILTDWTEFRALNLKELRKRVRNPLLIDLRNKIPF